MSDAYFNFQDFYSQVAARKDFERYVEVGVYTGASVVFLCEELKKRKTDFSLYAVDLWECANDSGYTDLAVTKDTWKAFEKRMRESGTTKYINVMKVDSKLAAMLFQPRSVDFVFIDADHSYAACKADIEAWLPRIRPGGMIAGHDILEKTCGVEQAVTELFTDRFRIFNNCWMADV